MIQIPGCWQISILLLQIFGVLLGMIVEQMRREEETYHIVQIRLEHICETFVIIFACFGFSLLLETLCTKTRPFCQHEVVTGKVQIPPRHAHCSAMHS